MVTQIDEKTKKAIKENLKLLGQIRVHIATKEPEISFATKALAMASFQYKKMAEKIGVIKIEGSI